MKSVWRSSESDPARTLRPVPAPKRPRPAKASPRDEARRLLHAHEEERRRLSLALHDSMTQSLAALATNVDLIERSASVLSPRTRAIVAETRFIARQCFQQVRRLTDNLYPPLVAEVGLPLALRCTVANFAERTGVRIACQTDDCPRLPLEIEIALFRVVEDCLSTVSSARARQCFGEPRDHARRGRTRDPSGDARHGGPLAAPLRASVRRGGRRESRQTPFVRAAARTRRAECRSRRDGACRRGRTRRAVNAFDDRIAPCGRQRAPSAHREPAASDASSLRSALPRRRPSIHRLRPA